MVLCNRKVASSILAQEITNIFILYVAKQTEGTYKSIDIIYLHNLRQIFCHNYDFQLIFEDIFKLVICLASQRFSMDEFKTASELSM